MNETVLIEIYTDREECSKILERVLEADPEFTEISRISIESIGREIISISGKISSQAVSFLKISSPDLSNRICVLHIPQDLKLSIKNTLV
jgi:hypothetical protein